MFILSSFEYCSTLYFNLNNKVDEQRLEKTFAKACHQLLDTRLATKEKRLVNKVYKLVYVDMDITQQAKTLSTLNLMPLKLRLTYHFLNFLFSKLLKNNSCSLVRKILSFRKPRLINRINHFIIINSKKIFIN